MGGRGRFGCGLYEANGAAGRGLEGLHPSTGDLRLEYPFRGSLPGGAGRRLRRMRQALTWEAPATAAFAAPAGLRHKVLLVVAFALPVPLLAATGLTLPLPDSVYRLATAAVERTVAIARDLPAVGHEQKREAPRPAVERTQAQPAATVQARATTQAPAPAKAQRHGAHAAKRTAAAVLPASPARASSAKPAATAATTQKTSPKQSGSTSSSTPSTGATTPAPATTTTQPASGTTSSTAPSSPSSTSTAPTSSSAPTPDPTASVAPTTPPASPKDPPAVTPPPVSTPPPSFSVSTTTIQPGDTVGITITKPPAPPIGNGVSLGISVDTKVASKP